MRFRMAGLLILAMLASSARAGITVTSYMTHASTNGFAPSLQGPYFEQQSLENISPALAEVSGDWTGPNADGTPGTWHWIGSAQISSTTNFDADTLAVTASGNFAHQLTTTAQFVDPRPSTFTPGSVARYDFDFTLSDWAMYSVQVELGQWSRVRLGSITTGAFIFNYTNVSATPQVVALSGVLPPGHYDFTNSTGVGLPNLGNGVHNRGDNGNFNGLSFVVQVPEPSLIASLPVILALFGCGRRQAR